MFPRFRSALSRNTDLATVGALLRRTIAPNLSGGGGCVINGQTPISGNTMPLSSPFPTDWISGLTPRARLH